jgi:hypothetical protein
MRSPHVDPALGHLGRSSGRVDAEGVECKYDVFDGKVIGG